MPAALAAAAVLYLYALVAGTPYQEAKAIAIAAPLAMLVSVRALFEATPPLRGAPRSGTRARSRFPLSRLRSRSRRRPAASLALANGPVGPNEWTPDLIELRESGDLGPGGEDGDDTIVLAPEEQLAKQHGEDLYLWELRGGRVCADLMGAEPPPGVEHVVRYAGAGRFALEPRGIVGALGEECPFIADGDRADLGSDR